MVYKFGGTKMYEGEWKADKKTGKGKEIYEGNGKRWKYEGSFLSNAKHGYGKLTSLDGFYFEIEQ